MVANKHINEVVLGARDMTTSKWRFEIIRNCQVEIEGLSFEKMCM
jgi:hypothetical protein